MVYEREAGLRQIRILELDDGRASTWSRSPSRSTPCGQHENPEFDTTLLRFTYTSLVTPNSVVDYDMAARTWTVRKQTEVLGGYDPARYRSERLFATAPDGTRVPSRWSTSLPLERGRPAAAAAPRLRRVRRQLRPGVLVQQSEPARPRLRGGDRPHPGRRGDGPRLVRGREAAPEAEHLHRLHRGGGAPGRGGLHLARPAGDHRRQRGRPPDGRGDQPPARTSSAPWSPRCRSWTW